MRSKRPGSKWKSESDELESLGRVAQGGLPNDDLSNLVETIAARVAAVGIEIVSTSPTTETVRSWRTALETRLAALTKRSAALQSSLGLLEELPKRRQELAQAELRLKEVRAAVVLATRRTSEASERLRDRRAQIERLDARLTYLVGRRDTLVWIEDNKGLHTELRSEVVSISEKLDNRFGDLDLLSDRKTSLSAMLGQIEVRKASATRALNGAQSELQHGRAILEGMEGWQAKTRRLASISEEEEVLRRSGLEIQRYERQLRAALQAVAERDRGLTSQIETIEEKRGEMDLLISALQDHVEGGVCPACGHDHGGHRALLDGMAARLGREVATDERLTRNDLRTKIDELTSTIDEVEGRRVLCTHGLAELDEEREAVAMEVEAFLVRMTEFAKPVANDVDTARMEVSTRCATLDRQIGEWTAELASADAEAETARREWEETSRSIRHAQEEASELKNRLGQHFQKAGNAGGRPPEPGRHWFGDIWHQGARAREVNTCGGGVDTEAAGGREGGISTRRGIAK